MNEGTFAHAEQVMRRNLSVPVIITKDPFTPGRLRVFSEIKDHQFIDSLLSDVIPVGVAWDHNNPVELFRDFVLASEDGLRVIKTARMWRNLTRAGIVISVGLAIALITVIHMSGIIK